MGSPCNLVLMRKVSFAGSMLTCAALCLLASSCASSASKACSKLSTLCGAELSSDDLRDCAETINAASQETKVVLSDMELIAPVVKVNALCGSQTDTTDAFRRDLSKAQAGDRRADTIKLFSTRLTESAELCDLTLSLTEGSTPPARYCLRKGITRPGRC